MPDTAWDAASAQQAAALLLRLGDATRAVGLLRQHAAEGGDAVRFLLAQALAADRDIEGAREAYHSTLAHAVMPGVDHLRACFAFERDHGSPDQAGAAFTRLRDHGYWADPFGGYRAGLLVRQPLAAWSLLDVAGVLALLATTAQPSPADAASHPPQRGPRHEPHG